MNGGNSDDDFDEVDIDDLNVDDVDDDLDDDDVDDDDSDDDDVDLSSDDDDDEFGDTVIGANVDALVARQDAKDANETAKQRAARKRLEELREQKNADLDSTFNFNLDDEN